MCTDTDYPMVREPSVTQMERFHRSSVISKTYNIAKINLGSMVEIMLSCNDQKISSWLFFWSAFGIPDAMDICVL